jgi:hypothetical protein
MISKLLRITAFIERALISFEGRTQSSLPSHKFAEESSDYVGAFFNDVGGAFFCDKDAFINLNDSEHFTGSHYYYPKLKSSLWTTQIIEDQPTILGYSIEYDQGFIFVDLRGKNISNREARPSPEKYAALKEYMDAIRKRKIKPDVLSSFTFQLELNSQPE